MQFSALKRSQEFLPTSPICASIGPTHLALATLRFNRPLHGRGQTSLRYTRLADGVRSRLNGSVRDGAADLGGALPVQLTALLYLMGEK